MDNKNEKKNEAVAKMIEKTVEMGKKVASNVHKGAKAISNKTKNEIYQRKIKKFNPVFPETYYSDAFNRPNMIMIVDDAERRGIDVCEGSIGWINKENNMEVMRIYDEVVNECGIQFIPFASCDAVYYVDSFDRNRYIRVDCIFSKAHEEKIAELKHIAHSLGAKKCIIEISETMIETKSESKKVDNTQKVNTKYGVVSQAIVTIKKV